MQNNVVFVFDDLTEFFAMQKAIDIMQKNGILVDIIVPYDSGYNGLAKHTIKKIRELGYTAHNDAPKNKTYKILLTPYPGLTVIQRIKHIYHIQYPYGALSSKPNPTFLPLFRVGYDAIISFNKYDGFLDAYGCTVYPVPYWRYYNFKKKTRTTSKPILLILPTFGQDASCINDFTKDSIKNIKKHFHIITKAHHAIHFSRENSNDLDKLQEIADEFYDSDTPIDSLLSKADIVLSDNSGAIFESICANIPVVLFAKNINSRHLDKINTLQYELAKQNILPYAKNAKQILPILLNIKPYIKKQSNLREKLFLKIPKNPLKDFLDVINHFLKIDEKTDYHKIVHDIFMQEWSSDKTTIEKQQAKIYNLNAQISELSTKMQDYAELLEYKNNAKKVFDSSAYKIFHKIITPYKKIKNYKKHK